MVHPGHRTSSDRGLPAAGVLASAGAWRWLRGWDWDNPGLKLGSCRLSCQWIIGKTWENIGQNIGENIWISINGGSQNGWLMEKLGGYPHFRDPPIIARKVLYTERCERSDFMTYSSKAALLREPGTAQPHCLQSSQTTSECIVCQRCAFGLRQLVLSPWKDPRKDRQFAFSQTFSDTRT